MSSDVVLKPTESANAAVFVRQLDDFMTAWRKSSEQQWDEVVRQVAANNLESLWTTGCKGSKTDVRNILSLTGVTGLQGDTQESLLDYHQAMEKRVVDLEAKIRDRSQSSLLSWAKERISLTHDLQKQMMLIFGQRSAYYRSGPRYDQSTWETAAKQTVSACFDRLVVNALDRFILPYDDGHKTTTFATSRFSYNPEKWEQTVGRDRWKGRLQLEFHPGKAAEETVTHAAVGVKDVDSTLMKEVSQYLPYIRSKKLKRKSLDSTNMSKWSQVGPSWEHRTFPLLVLQGIQAHLASYLEHHEPLPYQEAPSSARHEAYLQKWRDKLWDRRYLVIDETIGAHIRSSAMPFIIRQIQLDLDSRVEEFLTAYDTEWKRKSSKMAKDVKRLTRSLSSKDGSTCMKEAKRLLTDESLLQSFVSVCKQALSWAEETGRYWPRPYKTSDASGLPPTFQEQYRNDCKTKLSKAYDHYARKLHNVSRQMESLRNDPLGEALRVELKSNEDIGIPRSLKSLVEYLVSDADGGDTEEPVEGSSKQVITADEN